MSNIKIPRDEALKMLNYARALCDLTEDLSGQFSNPTPVNAYSQQRQLALAKELHQYLLSLLTPYV